MYGEGIYLSSELHVSLMFSPTGHGWKHSRLGKRASVLAICEFIDHPQHLHYATKGKIHVLCTQRIYKKKKNIIFILIVEKSTKSSVPDKYFVITNNEILRLRYLIVYASENRSSSQTALYENRLMKWICNHKWVAGMIAYAVILLFIGISNSRQGYFFRQFIRQKTRDIVDYICTINSNTIDYIRNLFY